MALPLRFLVVCSALLFVCRPCSAQLPVAPEPHPPLDELVKEYKRLGLPLPPANAELVRVRRLTVRDSDEFGFRIAPKKPGDDPLHLVGSAYDSVGVSGEPFKPGTDIPDGVEPAYVSDLLCLAVQCRVHGLNEFATMLYARAREAIHTPVPVRLGFSFLLGFQTRVNGWELRAKDSSVLKELRLAASEYWLGQITAEDSDRKEVLRYFKEFEPGRKDDIRDLELTVAPRKSKPGTVEALIDDLTDYWPSGKPGSVALEERERGEAAYRKLVEMGFDAVPALLDHLADERFARYTHYGVYIDKTLGGSTLRVRVGFVVGQLLNDLSGRELTDNVGPWKSGPQWVNVEKARAWWKKAQKEGEEKWLVAHVVPESVGREDANAVIFRALGTKYPARLGEFYRTVLAKHPRNESRILADELVASKLPRADKLTLLTEGAEHKSLVHRNAALAALARLDPPTFRKHLLATLKKLPPDVYRGRYSPDSLIDLAALVWETDDAACWDALAALAKESAVYDRIEIIRRFDRYPANTDKSTQRELLRFLLRFLSDKSEAEYIGFDGEKIPGEHVQDVAAEVLAGHLKLRIPFSRYSSGKNRLLFRAVIAQLATEELARLKK